MRSLTQRASLSALAAFIAAVGLGPSPAFAVGKVIAFGDSITDGRGDEEMRGGYPPRLQEYLRANGSPDAVVVSAGVRGETTPEGADRIDGVLKQGGEFIVIMEGTNDIFTGVSTETTVDNLKEMVSKARGAGIKPVLATIPPFWFRASVNRGNVFTIDLKNRLYEEAVNSKISLAQVFDAFWRNPDRNLDLYDDRFIDRIGHPNAAGHSLIAQVVGDHLADNDTAPPVVGGTVPEDGSDEVSPSSRINIRLYDFGTGVAVASSFILINGQQVQTFRSESGIRTEVAHNPATPLSGVVNVEVITEDRAASPNASQPFATRFTIAGTNLIRGDIDGNGRVDGQDLARLAFSFGLDSSHPDYRISADIDNNGLVDGEDLAILANNFGRSAS